MRDSALSVDSTLGGEFLNDRYSIGNGGMPRNTGCKSERSQVTALSKYMASKFSARHHENVTGLICHSAGRCLRLFIS